MGGKTHRFLFINSIARAEISDTVNITAETIVKIRYPSPSNPVEKRKALMQNVRAAMPATPEGIYLIIFLFAANIPSKQDAPAKKIAVIATPIKNGLGTAIYAPPDLPGSKTVFQVTAAALIFHADN